MKPKENAVDSIVYIIACIVSIGAVWLTRIIISQAIRKSVQE